jgi:hypothetical protein
LDVAGVRHYLYYPRHAEPCNVSQGLLSQHTTPYKQLKQKDNQQITKQNNATGQKTKQVDKEPTKHKVHKTKNQRTD